MEDFFSNNLEILVPSVFSLTGLIMSISGIYYYRKAKKSLTWPTVIGKIITSEVIKEKRKTNNGYETTYEPEILYSYKIEFEEYTSNKIRSFFNYGSNSSARAYKLTEKYPVDSQVIIYYNPNKPKYSVLEPGVKTANIVFLIIGLALLVFPLILAYYLANNTW